MISIVQECFRFQDIVFALDCLDIAELACYNNK